MTSLRELGRRADVSHTTIRLYRLGKRRLTRVTEERVRAVLEDASDQEQYEELQRKERRGLELLGRSVAVLGGLKIG